MKFEDRHDAARQLIPHLKKYAGENVLVLAIPRGGVPIGCEVAKAYGWPLDILLTKKIGHPANPEFAIGSVSLEGEAIDPDYAFETAYIDAEIKRIRRLLKDRYQLFMGNRQPHCMEGKTVIVTDDGIATGHTMLASLDVVRNHHPKQIVVAIPVAPPAAARLLKQKADDLICLQTPYDFSAVGQFYESFSQVSDEEVLELLDNMSRAQPN